MWEHALGIKLCPCLPVDVFLTVMSDTVVRLRSGGLVTRDLKLPLCTIDIYAYVGDVGACIKVLSYARVFL